MKWYKVWWLYFLITVLWWCFLLVVFSYFWAPFSAVVFWYWCFSCGVCVVMFWCFGTWWCLGGVSSGSFYTWYDGTFLYDRLGKHTLGNTCLWFCKMFFLWHLWILLELWQCRYDTPSHDTFVRNTWCDTFVRRSRQTYFWQNILATHFWHDVYV